LSTPALVVVIDDDVSVRTSLKFLLELEGFVVHSYASAAEFLSTDDVERCSCLVTDQNMPGMSGLDLIAQLRTRHASAPAILITSDPSLFVRERARKAATRSPTDTARSTCAVVSRSGSSSQWSQQLR
jgi:FixJ family two-component response regulator